jgi:dolichyl-phosphate-mannose--protein O-mannosyl transferase
VYLRAFAASITAFEQYECTALHTSTRLRRERGGKAFKRKKEGNQLKLETQLAFGQSRVSSVHQSHDTSSLHSHVVVPPAPIIPFVFGRDALPSPFPAVSAGNFSRCLFVIQ